MKEINYWDFCDSFSVNEAAHYILELNHDEKITDEIIIKNLNAVSLGLKKAILNGTMKASIKQGNEYVFGWNELLPEEQQTNEVRYKSVAMPCQTGI